MTALLLALALSEKPKRFCAVRVYRDGGEAVVEYFATLLDAIAFIEQNPPKCDEWSWSVGEWGVG